jgi:hypothetical protein
MPPRPQQGSPRDTPSHKLNCSTTVKAEKGYEEKKEYEAGVENKNSERRKMDIPRNSSTYEEQLANFIT